MAHVALTNVVVRYPVYTTERQRSILGLAAHQASFGRIARDAGKIPYVDALNGVSFTVKEGERLAIIGRNGSGKTTALKVCAGLIVPASGDVDVEGQRACLLSAGAGFDLDRTGVENVEMIGRLLGLSREERTAVLEDVIDFTELGDFLELPVRTYSAGMLVRLKFSLASRVNREVLIMDEAIGAGDAHFVEKAATRLQAALERAKVLIIATHAGHIAKKWCNRAIWLDKGTIVMEGEPKEVWEAYSAKK